MLEILASDHRGFVQDILAWVICICALVWGGSPERVIAASWLFLFEVSAVVYRELLSSGYRLNEVDVFLSSSDFLAGLLWLGVGLYANRSYTLWIAALQLLAVMAHLVRGFAEAVSPIAYAVMFIVPGWLQLFFLAGGLICHIQRKKRFGNYRDWRFSDGSIEQVRPKGIDRWVFSIASRRSKDKRQ